MTQSPLKPVSTTSTNIADAVKLIADLPVRSISKPMLATLALSSLLLPFFPGPESGGPLMASCSFLRELCSSSDHNMLLLLLLRLLDVAVADAIVAVAAAVVAER